MRLLAASVTMVGVRKLILGLVVLLGLALLVDFGAAAWSEYRVSRACATAVP